MSSDDDGGAADCDVAEGMPEILIVRASFAFMPLSCKQGCPDRPIGGHSSTDRQIPACNCGWGRFSCARIAPNRRGPPNGPFMTEPNASPRPSPQPPASSQAYPRKLILAAAIMAGMLLALAVHMIGQRFGLDMEALWRSREAGGARVGAALAWWIIAGTGFVSGYATANLMESAVTGHISRSMKQFLVGGLVLLLAAAGQAAAAPAAIPTISGIVAGLVALVLGAVMAFCGAHFALRHE